jgi:hypothetical protein
LMICLTFQMTAWSVEQKSVYLKITFQLHVQLFSQNYGPFVKMHFH